MSCEARCNPDLRETRMECTYTSRRGWSPLAGANRRTSSSKERLRIATGRKTAADTAEQSCTKFAREMNTLFTIRWTELNPSRHDRPAVIRGATAGTNLTEG